MENNILVRDLTKRFPDFTLDRVSFQVPKGRIVGFIGENGAGKSTLLKTIAGDKEIGSGTITFEGSLCRGQSTSFPGRASAWFRKAGKSSLT